MKHLGALALISWVALGGCENSSRLDRTVKSLDKAEAKEAKEAAKGAEAAPIKADHSGSIEDRVARLEENYARYAESLDFLSKVYDQQKAQQKAQQDRAQREDPDPDAVFAVDVANNVRLGMVEGPAAGALVTIVEAWDFA